VNERILKTVQEIVALLEGLEDKEAAIRTLIIVCETYVPATFVEDDSKLYALCRFVAALGPPKNRWNLEELPDVDETELEVIKKAINDALDRNLKFEEAHSLIAERVSHHRSLSRKPAPEGDGRLQTS